MGAASTNARAAVLRLRDRLAPPARRLWPWVPVLFGVVYALLLLTSLRSVVQSIYRSADSSSALTIGQAYPDRPAGSIVTLGNFPWYSTLWFEQLTRGLPAHREIWQVAPWMFSLAGVGMVAWSTVRAAGRWAGTMAGLALACAAPPLLTYQFSWSVHAWTFFHVCLLGFFLVLWAIHGGRLGGSVLHLAGCAFLAAATAVGLASDTLLTPAGLAPFLVAGLALAVMLPAPAGRRIGASALGVSVVSAVGASIIGHAMRADGVHTYPFDLFFAPWNRIVPNARLSAQSLAFLFNGDFGGEKVAAKSVLTFACALAILGGALWAALHLRDWGRAIRASIQERTRAGLADDPARTAHVAFWGLAGTIMLVAFILSTTPVDRTTSRYIITAGYAIAALLPVAAVRRGGWARPAVVIGLCVILTGSVAALVRRDLQDTAAHFPGPALSGPLDRLAKEQGLRYGYAGYWDASPLTWQSDGTVEIYPVRGCPGTVSGLCPFQFHQISSWYSPKPGVRTFLLSDPAQPLGALAPSRALGPPELVRHIGAATVYVYGYDIASKFSP